MKTAKAEERGLNPVIGTRHTRRQLGRLMLAGSFALPLISKDAAKQLQNAKVLAITFQGPFAFSFLDKTVRVYAPPCTSHEAYVQTDQEQLLLGRTSHTAPKRGYEYVVPSFRPDISQTDCHNYAQMIAVDQQRCSHPNGPALKDSYCQLLVPRPDLILGLALDPLTYTPNDLPSSNPVCGCWATAMRFFYTGFDTTQGLKLVQTQPLEQNYPNGKTLIDTSNYPDVPDLQDYYSMSFRYNPQHPSNAPHHDAIEGFSQMRKMFPPFDKWNVSFDNCKDSCLIKSKGQFYLVHHTGDCGAAQMILASQTELQYWQKPAK